MSDPQYTDWIVALKEEIFHTLYEHSAVKNKKVTSKMTTYENKGPDSELVFEKMTDIIGTPEILTIRRDVMDVTDILKTRSVILNQVVTLTANLGGSRREGFRFLASDYDLMITNENFRVIWNLSQHQRYDEDSAIYKFDGSYSPPGYGLLQEIRSPLLENNFSCIINGKSYASSSNWTSSSSLVSTDLWIHGPCVAMNVPFSVIDGVECMRSEFWPPSASSFKKRCQLWPEPSILHDIVRNGCHLVPIGHKLGIHGKEEWRISFATAEKRLVYSLNHSQFLLYGLMKIFMKEVINRSAEENDELLCSYHMKTAIFWVLQQSSLHECNSRSFLRCFWICFKLVIKWVYEGVCPNFFIPENNLFLVKIHGFAQNKLFCELYAMYEKGLSCLFECPSIRFRIDKSLTTRAYLAYPKKINPLIMELFIALNANDVFLGNLQSCVKTLMQVEKLLKLNLTRVYALLIQRATAVLFHQMAFCLMSLKFCNNKSFYYADKLSRSAIGLSVKFGDVSEMLFSAMYHFRKHNIKKALAMLERAKVVINRPDMVHLGHLFSMDCVDTKPWLKWSLSDMAMTKCIFPVSLCNETFYIDELVREQQHSLKTPLGGLIIPSLGFLHMLEFLCYRNVNTLRAHTALNELKVLLDNIQNIFTVLPGRDILWHMLGKFEEMSGNPQMALYAYRKSLDEIGINKIRTATVERINIA